LENIKAIPEKYEKFKEDIQTQEGKQEFKESALSLVLNPIRGFARIEQKAKPTLNVPFIDDSKLEGTPKKDLCSLQYQVNKPRRLWESQQ